MDISLLGCLRTKQKPIPVRPPSYFPLAKGKPQKLNWARVAGVAAPITGALVFILAYGLTGTMSYNDELLIAQSVENRRHEVVCEASRDEATRIRYNVTLAQIAAEDC